MREPVEPVEPVEPLEVLVADDHEVIRFGLTTLLDAAPDMRLVGEATNGGEAVDLARRLKPDVVVMDLSMPGMDGLTAIELLLQGAPEMKVLVLSAFGQPDIVDAAFAAGARGYLNKGVTAQDVLDGIRAVAAGAYVLPGPVRGYPVAPGPRPGQGHRSAHTVEEAGDGSTESDENEATNG